MAVQIQLRNDTAANWTAANPTLAAGEIGVETDTGSVKVGDGATAWSSLSYFGVGSTYVDNAISTELLDYSTTLQMNTAISNAVAGIVDTAPDALNTLNELAAALGDDANFATTVTNSLAGKQDIVTNVSDTEIGYLDGVTSGIQGQLDAKVPLTQNIVELGDGVAVTSTYLGKLITNSFGISMTVVDEATGGLLPGQQVDFLQMHTDPITFTAGANVTLYSKDGNLSTAAQYSPASLKCVATNTYVLVGDLGA